MTLFGISPQEVFFFLLIMLIILGPMDMVKLGRSLGTNLRKLWDSPTWRTIFSTSNTLRNLPNALMRETGVEELRQELRREADTIKKMGKEVTDATQWNVSKAPAANSTPVNEEGEEFPGWTTPVGLTPPPGIEENSILPPHLTKPNPSPTGEEPHVSAGPPSPTD